MLNFVLIEDENLFAKSVKRRLEREGHQAIIADNISDGKNCYARNQLMFCYWMSGYRMAMAWIY